MKRLLLALALLGLPVAALAQTSAVPTLFSYHGKVTDATGTLIGAGTPVNRAVTFRIWASPSSVSTAAGNRLYTEVQTVTIANGEFSVLLGTGAAVGTELKPALDTVFNGAERYLGITVDDPTVATDPEISPRQQMVSTAFAFRAKVAEGLSGSITGSQIADGSISAAKIASGAITADKIGGGQVSYGKVAHNTVDSAIIIDENVTTADLAPNAVTEAKIGGAAVTAAKIGTDAVETAKIKNGAVTDVKLAANSVTQGAIAPSSIMNSHIQDSTITAAKLAFTPGGGTPAANSVNTTQLVDNAVTGAKLAASSVATGALAANSVTAAKIGNGEVTFAKLNADFFSTYFTHSVGLRVDRGLNVNHPGEAGSTMTIQANSADTFIANLVNQAGVSIFNVLRTGNAQLFGVLSQSSDRRLKHNINPLVGSLEKLLRLRPVTFEYNDPVKFKAGVHAGFIAQDIEEVFPEWVFTEEDGMKSIGFRGFESTTVQALRELRAEKDQQLQQRDATIAALEKNVAAMKAESADTKAQLAALQQTVAALTARASN